METFETIYARAASRKGGPDALEELLPVPASDQELQNTPDHRYLSEMTKCVFRSGFVWKIIEAKWAGFEEAFQSFDVNVCTMLSDENLEQLTHDDRIVKHAKKIASVRLNALYVQSVRETHGGFGAFLAQWPAHDIVGLWNDMKQKGNRLGGQTGRYFLRFMGKDTPSLSADVVKALVQAKVVEKDPTSKKALALVQDAFNAWHDESGKSYSAISRVLACSVD